MATLTVESFSCIQNAVLETASLTILIGPQASGKSVLSKLLYFFNDVIDDQPIFVEDLTTFEDFTKYIEENFRKSFPQQAWGPNAFQVTFESGPLKISVQRSKPRKKSPGRLRWTFSEFLTTEYARMMEETKAAREKSSQERVSRRDEFELNWRIRRRHEERLQAELARDYVAAQLFVPAGRSFFTSMGKTVVAFEQGGYLDPLTIRFGRYFLSMRDFASGRHMIYRPQSPNKQKETLRTELGKTLFGGDIKMERNEDYVQTADGRKIPFSYLSSGQQELLPLWIALNEFTDDEDDANVIYIEEPEAHLFPTAQSVLMEYLAGLVGESKRRRMLITTHSPYVLAKVNNFLKAGALASVLSKVRQQAVERIIPRNAWLNSAAVKAYAIVDHTLTSLIADDGLVDAEYLDGVSEEIAHEFTQLLGIESAL
ncbi:MAG TPA: AAA family ATPase [Beijerinckiaceae bacterium]|jgi:hypothetical protein